MSTPKFAKTHNLVAFLDKPEESKGFEQIIDFLNPSSSANVQIFEKAKKEIDDLKLTLEKFENSSKNLSKLLEIQVSDKFMTGVGYDSQVVDSQVFDSQVFDSQEEYVFSKSITSVPAVATSEVKTAKSKPKFVSEPLIEDWISDSEDENETEFKSKQRKPSFAKVEFVKSNKYVKTPKESIKK
ncbi:hypothetical protein Tco_0076022, partial [Tanacetum coccineum]